MLDLLLGACEGEEECRGVVAECLGRLALLHGEAVLPALQQRLASPSANARSVVGPCTLSGAVDCKTHPSARPARPPGPPFTLWFRVQRPPPPSSASSRDRGELAMWALRNLNGPGEHMCASR